MIASLAFSYATPIDKMHSVRPLHSLFHPSIFISILGQVCCGESFVLWQSRPPIFDFDNSFPSMRTTGGHSSGYHDLRREVGD